MWPHGNRTWRIGKECVLGGPWHCFADWAWHIKEVFALGVTIRLDTVVVEVVEVVVVVVVEVVEGNDKHLNDENDEVDENDVFEVKIDKKEINIYFASLIENNSSAFKVDFRGKIIDKSLNPSWIVFPWEKYQSEYYQG